MRTIGDQQLLKCINSSVLLRLSRCEPGLSHARLSQHSGLTKSTVSALVRELLGWRSAVRCAPAGVGVVQRPSSALAPCAPRPVRREEARHPTLLATATQTASSYAQSAGVMAPTVRVARYGILAAAVGAAAVTWPHQLRPLRQHNGSLLAQLEPT